MTAPAEFTVTLHQLAPDLSEAGQRFSDTAAGPMSAEALRERIEAFARLAPATQYPTQPELRIVGPTGRFLVQARNGEMRVSSWSAQAGGAGLSAEQIVAMVLGVETVVAAPPRGAAAWGGARRNSGRGKLAALVLGVVGVNGLTVWLLVQPPPPLPPEILPAYQVVAPERAQRVLDEFAGEFDTGMAEGDRHLSIRRDGGIRWFKWGASRQVEEETSLRASAAESRGRAVLVTENSGMIELKDPITIVFFGDTYRRKSP